MQPMFGEPIAPFHKWFAWFPVRTWDGRWCWFQTIKRRLIQKHEYLTGGEPLAQWWQYAK